jgi:exopolyphosphatase/pppGpp-phosphohydrolase
VIVGGVAIYSRLLTWARAAELVTSDRGIRWGLAFERASLSQRKAARRSPKARSK